MLRLLYIILVSVLLGILVSHMVSNPLAVMWMDWAFLVVIVSSGTVSTMSLAMKYNIT